MSILVLFVFMSLFGFRKLSLVPIVSTVHLKQASVVTSVEIPTVRIQPTKFIKKKKETDFLSSW